MSPSIKTLKPQALITNILHSLRSGNHSTTQHTTSSSASSQTPPTTDTPESSSIPAKVETMSPALTTSLIGKVAIVTGSSRSIGAAVAKSLGEQGASVIVNYVNDAAAAMEVVKEIKSKPQGDAVAVKADISTVEGGKLLLDEAVKAFGKLDILILNAGIMGSKPLADLDEAFFDDHLRINVKTPLFIAKAATAILPSPGGRIIFFSSSLTGSTTILPNALSYVASKGAIEQISRVLAKDLGGKGITVNVVSPGPVDTTLFRAGKPQKVIEMIAGQNPNNRLALPEDIAPMVAFVASPAASWVNGQNLRVNGGFVV